MKGPGFELPFEHRIVSGPEQEGSEERWNIELADGRRAVLAHLSEELARDESVRRRWVRDVKRLMNVRAPAVVPILAVGPGPSPELPGTSVPWRVRLDPGGEPLSQWLARAPVPVEELARLGASLADALLPLHREGLVLRDLSPRHLVRTDDDRVLLTDVGLARVDVLSSHTASSLLLAASPYASPEQLRTTSVDARADVYALGVLLWQAATGTLPFGDGRTWVLERAPLPPLCKLVPNAPKALEHLLARCLAESPGDRPDGVAEVAWVLRGGAGSRSRESRTSCQSCGAGLYLGQRLCLQCGREAVRFHHTAPRDPGSWSLDILELSEDPEQLGYLQELVSSIAAGPIEVPEFVLGSAALYSDEERARRIRLPARLFRELTQETAEELARRLEARGVRVQLVSGRANYSPLLSAAGAGVVSVGAITLLAVSGLPFVAAALGAAGTGLTGALLAKASNALTNHKRPAQYYLRSAPVAVDASDPLVARLGVLLRSGAPEDARAVLSRLALWVERLFDHRARHARPGDLALALAPAERAVAIAEAEIAELIRIRKLMEPLEESKLVRGLAVAEARKEPESVRRGLLMGLDHLRALEEARAASMHRLLEAADLMRRAAEVGLSVRDDAADDARALDVALAALGSPDEATPS